MISTIAVVAPVGITQKDSEELSLTLTHTFTLTQIYPLPPSSHNQPSPPSPRPTTPFSPSHLCLTPPSHLAIPLRPSSRYRSSLNHITHLPPTTNKPTQQIGYQATQPGTPCASDRHLACALPAYGGMDALVDCVAYSE